MISLRWVAQLSLAEDAHNCAFALWSGRRTCIIINYVTVLKSYISYFGKFSQYMNSYVSGPTTYSHF